jgi:uncharacterized membrane protein
MDHIGLPIAAVGLLGSLFNLGGRGHYIHWHFINISVANLIVIGLMLLVFVLAIVVPFPGRKAKRGGDDGAAPR